MKVSFITPPSLDGKRIPERVFGCTYGLYPIPNIFVITFATLLQERGLMVKVLDAPIEGLSNREFVDYLQKDDSDMYVIYSVNLAKSVDMLCHRIIRDIKGDIPVVFIGPAPTYTPDYYLSDEKTFVLRGLPAFTLFELTERLGSGDRTLKDIKGLSCIIDGKSVHNEERPLIKSLDELPDPDRTLIKRDLYFSPKLWERPFTVALTSLGCAYNCNFCVPCSLSFARELEFKKTHPKKPPVIFKSVERVVGEFERIADEGYKTVSILDDEFVWSDKRTIAICEGIAGLGLKWGCLARADYLTNEDVVRSLASAGCKYVDIGVESFNQEILDDIGKDLDISTIYKAVELLQKHNIKVKFNILFGSSPLETISTIRQTITEIIKIKPFAVMFSITNPFPGTQFYELAKHNGWLYYGDYIPVDLQKSAIISYPHLSKKRMEILTKIANFRFYLRPSVIFSNISKVLNPRNFISGMSSIVKKLTGWGSI